jgi:hypothetical protein
MKFSQEYDLKRNNFISKVTKYFEFLILEFNYRGPEIMCHKQENGTIIRDTINYINIDKKRKIELSNSYHPNDYGFELLIYNLIDKKSNDFKMLYNQLKEKQDIEQEYLKEISDRLRKEFYPIIEGQDWIN